MAGSAARGADTRESCSGRAEPLSLLEVLRSYEQPINEEQAWAVGFQCCRGLQARGCARLELKGPASILLHRDGAVTLRPESSSSSTGTDPGTQPQSFQNSTNSFPFSSALADGDAVPASPVLQSQLVQSLGVAIYRALDWGLADSEERELSPQLERLIERMVGGEESGDSSGCSRNATKDEGYSGPEEEEEEEEVEEGSMRAVRTFRQVMALCACRLPNPTLAPEHYPAVCRALFLETLELQTFLCKIRDAKEMLKKIRTEEPQDERYAAELDNLKHTDWARLWVQLMKELRQGVKLKKVEEQPFNPLPTEFSLTPFEMLMQDIRSRKYKLRKVMVDGDIPTRVKRNAHEVILDFIRSRPPLKPASERSLPPRPQQQQSLHDRVLAEIRQEHKLRPVEPRSAKRRASITSFSQSAAVSLRLRSVCFRVPNCSMSHRLVFCWVCGGVPCVLAASYPVIGWVPPSPARHSLSALEETSEASASSPGLSSRQWMEEFSHPVESLALTVDEVISVRRVLVKAEMEKFLQNKELYNSLKKGKVCCCCRVRFPLFSWPSTCLLCKRLAGHSVPVSLSACLNTPSAVCDSCSAKMKMPAKKMAHIPVYTVGFHSSPRSHGHRSEVYKSLRSLSRRSVEEEFPYLYAAGCSLRDVCAECTKFVADVISSSRRSLDIINNTPKREKPHPRHSHTPQHYPRGGLN
ncbi:hypothetical protein NFI96_015992 [Prochilodus magdalenae]|nr:hypothetical protein NFI96_015992 [Prochilodus magdalenae]